MLISCSICKDIFFPNSEVCGTQCGHLYHELCLKKWQERSGSCPHCRTKLREKPRRIYFVIEDNIESEAEFDGEVLREKLGSVREDLADAKRKNEQLEESYDSLQKELAAYTEKAASAEVTIRALKQRVKELNRENDELKPLLMANESLKLELKSMTNLRAVLQGTESEVREMINKTPVTPLAVHQLCVYVEALKNQLKVSEEKFKNENERLLMCYKSARQKLKDLSNEGESKRVQTSSKKQKAEPNTSLKSMHSLKRPIDDCSGSLSESENKSEYSRDNAEFRPPVPKKQPSLVLKKVINNLDKSIKKDIPSDSSDIDLLIFPGPYKRKVLKSVTARESTSIFNKFKPAEKAPADVNSRSDVAYNIWGRSTRNILAVSSLLENQGSGTFQKKK